MKKGRIATPTGAPAAKDGRFIGRTLGYAARSCGFRFKGYRVYILSGTDTTGTLTAQDYDLKRIVRACPELKSCRVASIEDYYGILIFRVRAGT